MLANLKGLHKQGFSVDCFYLNTQKSFSDPAAWPHTLQEHHHPKGVFVNTRIHPFNMLTNLLGNESFHASRFFHPAAEQERARLLQEGTYEAVLLESIYMGVYLPCIKKHFSGTVLLRAHNIEHLLWKRVAAEEKNPLKKKYLHLQTQRLKAFEHSVWEQCDGVLAITDLDARVISKQFPDKRIFLLPYAYGGEQGTPGDLPGKDPVFFHLGSMNWMPNADGIRWLVKHAWPLVHQTYPGAQLCLAGRHMPEGLLAFDGKMNIRVLGEVQDSHEFIRSGDIMICPLFSGGGMRIKIIEALALGKPVFSTPLGAEGIVCKNPHAPLLHFSGADELLALAGEVYGGSFDYRSRSAAAIEFVHTQFSHDVLYHRLREFINFEHHQSPSP